MLGYSPEALPEKLVDISGKLVADVTPLRRWTRRLERKVERWLGVDRVDIESSIAQNYIMDQWISSGSIEEDSLRYNYNYQRTLDHSRVMVGKYLSRDLYLSYTGSLMSSTDPYYMTRFGVVHNWDALLRLNKIAPNLVLNYRYEFDGLTRLDDNRIFIRFSYTFK